MASSGNQSFLIIASKRQLLPKARLERYLREAEEQGLELPDYLVQQGALDADEVVSVVRARARHGRACTACQQLTYMLPGNKPGQTPCEHCGGKLEAGPPQPKTGRPVIAVAGAPPPPIPGMSATVREQGLDDQTPVPDDHTPVPDDRTPNPDADRMAYPKDSRSSPYGEPAPPPYGESDNPYGAPASEGAPPWQSNDAPRPTHSLWTEAMDLVLFPVKTPQALALVTLGAIVAAFVQAASGSGIMVGAGCCGLVGLGIYVWMFLISVTREGTNGGSEVPAFPDFDLEAIIGTLVRVISFQLACFLPVGLILCLAFSFAPNAVAFLASRDYATIGANAHLLSGDKQPLKGMSTVDSLFLTPEGEAIDPSGSWTVIGLLGMDTADDTNTDVQFSDMSTGTVNHGFQIFDLDRVGRALRAEKVKVIAAYADPRKRLLTIRWPFTIPEDEREELFERFGGWDPEDLEGLDEDELELLSQGFVGAAQNPFQTVQFAMTDEFTFPAPFTELRRFPAVYIIDPAGVIVREYSTGVYDEKLYADILSLKKGGDGDAFAQSLPGHVYVRPGEVPRGNSGAVFLMFGLFGIAMLFGFVYFPMAYLLMVVYDSPGTPWLYPLAFKSMINTAGDYMGLLVIGGGIMILAGILNAILSVVFVSAPALLQILLVNVPSNWLGFYCQVAVCYAAGRFYYLNQDRLEWL